MIRRRLLLRHVGTAAAVAHSIAAAIAKQKRNCYHCNIIVGVNKKSRRVLVPIVWERAMITLGLQLLANLGLQPRHDANTKTGIVGHMK